MFDQTRILLLSEETSFLQCFTNALGSEFEVNSASDREQVMKMLAEAFKAGKPYALLFIDSRVQSESGASLRIPDMVAASPKMEALLWMGPSDQDSGEGFAITHLSDHMTVFKGTLESGEIMKLARERAGRSKDPQAGRDLWKCNPQAKFNDVLEALTHPFYVIDVKSHEIIVANSAAMQGGAITPGLTCHKLTHHCDTPCSGADDPCPLEMVLETKGPVVTEHVHYLPDGSTGIFEVHGFPILDEAGEVVQMIEYSLDITEKKATEEELRKNEHKFRSLLENAPDAVLVLEQGGIISQINHQLEILFDYDRKELLGKDIETLVPERFRAKHKHHISDSFKTPFTRPVELSHGMIGRRKDGSEFPIGISLSPVKTEDGLAYLAHIRDESERQERENILLQAKMEAESANKAKSEFLANMSHEIRTPMNGIIGMNSLLFDTELSDSQRECAEIVKISAESLLGLINDILDFSKIEANQLALEGFDFNLLEAIESVADTVSQLAFGKGLELIVDTDECTSGFLWGDSARLRQVLLNLATNAIKFTDDGEIVIKARALEVNGSGTLVRFEVSDTGIGIPADKQSAVFGRFSQADGSTTRKYGGTGLGLTISKQLVKLMEGEIGLESEPGKGSTFWFTARFQNAKEACPSRRKKTYDSSILDGKRVLVVDDNATNRLILIRLLEGYNCIVDVAEDGHEGLLALRAPERKDNPYHLILLDVMMPGMDGLQVAQSIRDENLASNALLLFLSSAEKSCPVAKLQELGVVRSLMKPLKHSQFIKILCFELNPKEVPILESTPRPEDFQKQVLPPLRVLIAEDNLINQKLATRILEKAGLTSDVVGNGLDAVNATVENGYDLILMDLQMPKMGGLEATRAIREREKTTGLHMPIIAVTANAMEGDREMCMEAGMDDYVSKPIQQNELFDVIARLMTGRPSMDKSA